MLCAANTAKGKQCSFKASNGKYCKKHTTNEKYARNIEDKLSKIIYHNHPPNMFKPDCPCCSCKLNT